jgi:hypothetical protein
LKYYYLQLFNPRLVGPPGRQGRFDQNLFSPKTQYDQSGNDFQVSKAAYGRRGQWLTGVVSGCRCQLGGVRICSSPQMSSYSAFALAAAASILTKTECKRALSSLTLFKRSSLHDKNHVRPHRLSSCCSAHLQATRQNPLPGDLPRQ